jgi:bacterioferritin
MPKGDPEVIEILNEILTAELTAINQYFIHSKMLDNWGIKRLAKYKWDESIDEMKDADRIIERILYLDGTPNMQRLSPVRVGEDAIEQHKLDLAMELDAVARYNRAVALAGEKGDNGTRALCEQHLKSEEESVDWLEAQLYQVEQLGAENYLAEQLKAEEGD